MAYLYSTGWDNRFVRLDRKTGQFMSNFFGTTNDLQKAATYTSKVQHKDYINLQVKENVPVITILNKHFVGTAPFVLINSEGEFLGEGIETTTNLQDAAVWDADYKYCGTFNKLLVSVKYRRELI